MGTLGMFNLNDDYVTRDEYLFGEYDKEKYRFGGVRHVSDLTWMELEYLFDNNFIDPEDSQNCSPTAEEIYDFIKDHDEFCAFGYAVSPDRSDYRITLEGIERLPGLEGIEDGEELKDFVKFARFADELDVDHGYAWWD